MTPVFSNLAKSSLAADITVDATELTLTTGTGDALFPSLSTNEYFMIVAFNPSTPSVKEFMMVTARSGDTLTVARAQEGSTAREWTVGDLIYHVNTAGIMSLMWENATIFHSGTITTSTLTTASGDIAEITISNTYILPTSTVVVSRIGGTCTDGIPMVMSVVPSTGSAVVSVVNVGPLPFNGTLIFSFSISHPSTDIGEITINGTPVPIGGSITISTSVPVIAVSGEADKTTNYTVVTGDKWKVISVDASTSTSPLTVTIDPTLGTVADIFSIWVKRSINDTSSNVIVVEGPADNVIGIISSANNSGWVPCLNIFADGTSCTSMGVG